MDKRFESQRIIDDYYKMARTEGYSICEDKLTKILTGILNHAKLMRKKDTDNVFWENTIGNTVYIAEKMGIHLYSNPQPKEVIP